jgi:hypothetical protein
MDGFERIFMSPCLPGMMAEWSARSERGDDMQSMKQQNSEIGVLTDAEHDAVTGGGILGSIVHFLHSVFAGPGDHRRPLDAPK